MPVDALGMEPVTLGDGEADRLSEAASA